jgi:hypothetical protein
LNNNSGEHPNLHNWDLQDVENRFETEGSVAKRTGVIQITQKTKEPLRKLCGALKKQAGLAGSPIPRSGVTGYAIQLGVQDSARFLRTFKKRVKTANALKDLERAEQRLRRKRKQYSRPARRAIQILEGSLI